MTELIRVTYTLRGETVSRIVTAPLARSLAEWLRRRYPGIDIELEDA